MSATGILSHNKARLSSRDVDAMISEARADGTIDDNERIALLSIIREHSANNFPNDTSIFERPADADLLMAVAMNNIDQPEVFVQLSKDDQRQIVDLLSQVRPQDGFLSGNTEGQTFVQSKSPWVRQEVRDSAGKIMEQLKAADPRFTRDVLVQEIGRNDENLGYVLTAHVYDPKTKQYVKDAKAIIGEKGEILQGLTITDSPRP